ncbi:c-5 sterol desaturase [Orbilia blumenaviensis]|uniref:C-5 sterol desaturase n=1 Tax=Orbilia blumenaviensis TaxID=1796055 RepID=A0AAV9V5N2_9PEZI
MDVVLSLCDTLFLDRFYASVLPVGNISASPDVFGANTNHTAAVKISKIAPSIQGQAFDSAVQLTNLIGLLPGKYADLSVLPRDDIYRQFFSLFLITWVFGCLLYFISSTLSYIFVFDKDTFKHPKFLKNQIRQEIWVSMKAHPGMSLLTAPFFLAEVRGHTLLFDNANQYGRTYFYLQFPIFIIFTDALIYLIHRGLHHPSIYKFLHKAHHKWIMPSPYASHAFHPVDGWAQSLPYHLFPLILPLWKYAYVGLFVFVNIWTVMIHDGEYVANSPIINGAACHTMHHLYFNYNYGQFTTLWDRLGGSYRPPNLELFYKETKMSKAELDKQVKEMEKMVKEVEGDDSFREYNHEDEPKKSK